MPIVVFLLVLAVAACAAGEDYRAEYHKEVLDNGATVVARYMPESPLVTVQMRVMSGLSNEGKYAGSGISHFLEHLIFKGAHGRTSKEVRKAVKAMGGVINGSTGLDSAEYHITVPKENFEKAFSLITEMVLDLTFTDEELEKEREVILKEIKMRNDTPQSKRIQLLFSQAYRENVYKYPIIGYEENFKALTREDIEKYHKAVYTPDRLVLGVVGGVPPEAVLHTAGNVLSRYERGNAQPADVFNEPRQVDERIDDFPAEVALGYTAIGFHTTSVYSSDLYASDVLSILLGRGNDSRLHKRLVKEKQLLYSVYSGNYTPRYPGLFVITGVGDPGKMEEAREEIFKAIDELAAGKIRDEELERAKNLVVADYLRSHERIESVVSSMTSSQILTGDPAFFEKYTDEIKKVGKEDVKEMLGKYLLRDNSTTVTLLPRRFLEETAAAGAPGRTQEEATITTLDNGIRVVVKRRPRLPLVSVGFAVPGGLRAEDRYNNGISNFTASLLLKGTRKRSESDIVPALEGMGGSINAFSGMNSIGMTMTVMSDDLDEGLDIFEDVIKNSEFPREEIDKLRKKVLASIREQETDIFEYGMIRLRKLIYGDHPYSMRQLGEIRTVRSITRDNIVAFYRERFTPASAVICVVGDIDAGEVTEKIDKRFGKWKEEVTPIEKQGVAPLAKVELENITMRKEQALVLFGFQGLEITDNRRHALSVISSLLSGADGLLFDALREEQGLTYSSGAASVPEVDPGFFFIYAATTEENLESSRKTIIEMLKKIRAGDITAGELEAAKSQLIAQHSRALEANSALAMIMSLDELYGLGFTEYKEYPKAIKAVTMQDIKDAAREILTLYKYAVVVVHSKQS